MMRLTLANGFCTFVTWISINPYATTAMVLEVYFLLAHVPHRGFIPSEVPSSPCSCLREGSVCHSRSSNREATPTLLPRIDCHRPMTDRPYLATVHNSNEAFLHNRRVDKVRQVPRVGAGRLQAASMIAMAASIFFNKTDALAMISITPSSTKDTSSASPRECPASASIPVLARAGRVSTGCPSPFCFSSTRNV